MLNLRKLDKTVHTEEVLFSEIEGMFHTHIIQRDGGNHIITKTD